ncbi:flagellin [Rubrivirga sp.]|uniref:flagellin N-terminal helical domain-containing protein n=1 Tax=Rubrivirga sp. TaxID=1885344 RepID=UPI003C75D47E
MSFRINTNTQAALSLSSLNSTSTEIGMRQYRLATGSKINSAGDDSAGFTISNKLTAKTRGQAQALSNIADTKSMLTVGEGALGTTMDILQTMKEKAVQAANDTLGTEERSAITNQLTALRDEIEDILGGSEFNGVKLFDGDGATTRTLAFQVGDTQNDTLGVDIDKLDATELGIGGGAPAAQLDYGSNWGNGGAFAVVESAVGTYAGGPDAFKFEVTAIDGTSGSEAVTFTVTDRAGNQQDYVYDASSGGADGLDTSGAGLIEGLTVNFDDAAGAALNASAASNGSFQVGDTFDIDVTSGSIDVSDASNARATIGTIDTAISKVSVQAAAFGDVQNRLDFKAQNLENSKTNYEAANSRIADADFAKEQMEIVKLQILQQTGSAMFAQANAAGQSVLSFF